MTRPRPRESVAVLLSTAAGSRASMLLSSMKGAGAGPTGGKEAAAGAEVNQQLREAGNDEVDSQDVVGPDQAEAAVAIVDESGHLITGGAAAHFPGAGNTGARRSGGGGARGGRRRKPPQNTRPPEQGWGLLSETQDEGGWSAAPPPPPPPPPGRDAADNHSGATATASAPRRVGWPSGGRTGRGKRRQKNRGPDAAKTGVADVLQAQLHEQHVTGDVAAITLKLNTANDDFQALIKRAHMHCQQTLEGSESVSAEQLKTKEANSKLADVMRDHEELQKQMQARRQAHMSEMRRQTESSDRAEKALCGAREESKRLLKGREDDKATIDKLQGKVADMEKLAREAFKRKKQTGKIQKPINKYNSMDVAHFQEEIATLNTRAEENAAAIVVLQDSNDERAAAMTVLRDTNDECAAKMVVLQDEHDERAAAMTVLRDTNDERAAKMVILQDEHDESAAAMAIMQDENAKNAAAMTVAMAVLRGEKCAQNLVEELTDEIAILKGAKNASFAPFCTKNDHFLPGTK